MRENTIISLADSNYFNLLNELIDSINRFQQSKTVDICIMDAGLTGEQIKPDQALKIGLIEEKVEDGKALETALSIASSVANQSPGSIAQCKELIHKARLSSEPYQEELEPFVNLFDTKDQKEGVEAFLGKRKPNWQNA